MRIVNPKKAKKLTNRTNYFNPDTTRTKVTVSSPDTYMSRQSKIEGYETRLYWQYRYCEDVDGQTFFYTLTYNNASIPRHYDIACFDYEDLRDLLTGGFRKVLFRKYGTTFKYFVGAELGDGKGVRGMHNNPHYHVLFFLEPAPHQTKRVTFVDVPDGVYTRNTKHHKKGETRYRKERREKIIVVPYKKITPKEFRHLVRMYWQGFDESETGYRSYKESKYGIAREGENDGLVNSFRACMYCAKYVCKDVKLKQHEDVVRSRSSWKHYHDTKKDDQVYVDFFYDIIYPMYNTPLNPSKTKWSLSEKDMIDMLLPGSFDMYKEIFGEIPDTLVTLFLANQVRDIIKKHRLWNDFSKYVHDKIQSSVDEDINEWRNRYCNKCRISHGVGDYAIEHINDKLNPTIQVPCKEGFKNRPIGLYYYRKMYCDVVKDSKGSNMYLLNDLGQKYRLEQLPKRISKLADKAKNNLALVLSNESLFEQMKDSDVNVSVDWSHKYLRRKMERLLKEADINTICKRYAEYKMVYEDRFFKYEPTGNDLVCDFLPIDVPGDYERFLVPSFYSVSRNDLALEFFLEDAPQNYLPYSAHPYFLRYNGIFNVLDLCADYWFIQKDDKDQKDAEERAKVKRFHDGIKLKEFYSQFN